MSNLTAPRVLAVDDDVRNLIRELVTRAGATVIEPATGAGDGSIETVRGLGHRPWPVAVSWTGPAGA